jgi:hypothetical protein
VTVVVFPALSEPVRRAIFVPGVEVAAGTATVWLAAPEVTSLTVADTSLDASVAPGGDALRGI